jgi:predicted RecA/RadA family phage recombinase
MSNVHRYLQAGDMIDHTPATALTSGQLFQINSVAHIAPVDIAAGAMGSVAASGVFRSPYVGGAANVGDNVWWDANGTPYGGSANGALTPLGADGDFWAGTITKAPSATDATVEWALNKVNPNLPAWPNQARVKTAVDLTVVAATHNGKVIEVTADAKTVTLPTGVAGMEYIIVNAAADGTALVTVDFDGNETCEGNLAIAATKTANNTKATAKRGDYLKLVCQTAGSLWKCVEKRGTWASS